MDDEAISQDTVTNRHPRKALFDSKAFRRLQRELRGGYLHWDSRFYRPAETYFETPGGNELAYWSASSKQILKTVRLDSLHGQHELRDYIILGEKPTFPHHLVTIRRPYHQAALNYLNDFNRDLFQNSIKTGSISYWALDLASRSIKKVGSTAYTNSPHLYNYSLSSAYTAWDIDHDKLAQVLVWDFSADEILELAPIYQKLEFRYGTEGIVIEHTGVGEDTPVAVGACFSGLPGTQDGASIRLLFSCELVIYEPFGSFRHSTPKDNDFWKTAPETPINANAATRSNRFAPLVTMIDLTCIASSHLKAVLKSYADIPPSYAYQHSVFIPTSRPVRFKPGERQRFDRKCTLAFGAIEIHSKMYHLFVIAIDPATRKHKVVIAKAFSSSVVFAWDNMVTEEAENLLRKALDRVVKVRGGNHDCKVDCEPVVGGLKGFEQFGCEVGAVEVIKMREQGVALRGWGAKGGELGLWG